MKFKHYCLTILNSNAACTPENMKLPLSCLFIMVYFNFDCLCLYWFCLEGGGGYVITPHLCTMHAPGIKWHLNNQRGGDTGALMLCQESHQCHMDWTNIFNTSHIITTLIQCMPHFCKDCSKVLPDHTKGLSSSGAFRKTWRCWLGWDRGKNKTSCFSGSLMLDGRKWGWWMGPHQSGQQTNITHPLFRIKSVSLWACCAMREGVNEMEGPVGVKNDQSLIHDPPPPFPLS